MNNRKLIQGFVFFFLAILGSIFLFHQLIPVASSRISRQELTVSEKISFRYVALGDSLTEGVGDTTGQGGFVPLLAQSLTNDYGYEVDYKNFGVSGNTSNQILKRMKEDGELISYLKTADLLTLTVGGNDLRKAIIKNIANLKVSTFDKPAKDYGKRLDTIIKTARKNNPNLPIYVVGIYNPLYLNFPELTEMQTIVDNWNTMTEQITEKYQDVYFVPINDLLYKGLEGEAGISQNGSQVTNNLLYGEDSFHPNNTGYEIMKKAILERMNETTESWEP
ncbi:SGNH/GDSL hydrolase family protein [Streptococcus suis]|uniref:Lysophospholipase L1 and related esterases n=1 Tax=Streptococcus suis TaxID=1307 RepID=A0A116L0N6_STRSU|nr:SGNH/GDSL hydrolase family protein [Streptococcus suis]NQH40664.1 SGNH/GDSL hydrolase family protein [Streptococcus suis]NQP17966.1 SGNH/GDSL hydrolase family protein [Streptococcus suis]CYU65954.1 lysophospholipase L1 and related esterases [Streptococcus suis]HEM3198421.1 SGNH/GDSL hydrolase family protein [Streptococcus suis 14A]HEM3670274.1 SGNH/GDSL hydrolase family protein [Streptococcus suis]